ncbi:MAG TPA: hypothetical protein VIM98_19975 [Dyella sp.]|uniref:hypothetical protein n=1 Tax=Dyella sp. TaxID=1869338 RepID=UPI002F92A2CF
MTTPSAHDEERLPGEDELAALYHKLPAVEPPAALDTTVLHTAAKAVQSAKRPRARWPLAVGSAAALAIVAGLAWRMGQMPQKAADSHQAAIEQSARTVTAPAAAAPAQAEKSEAKPTLEQMVVTTANAPAPAAKQVRRADSGGTALQAPGIRDKRATVAEAIPKAAPAMAPPPQPLTPAFAPASRVAESAIDTELRHIRELFAQDKRDEARQRLADFHRDHPDYPLPDDLRKQLLQP